MSGGCDHDAARGAPPRPNRPAPTDSLACWLS